MMNSEFRFYMPTKVLFRDGAAFDAGNEVKGERVLIISDPFLYQSGMAQRIGEGLSGRSVTYFSGIEPNPSCESVDEAAKAARDAAAECVVGVGGGSSLDVAKAVACLAGNPGSIYDYYSGGTKQFEGRAAQLICIPTTAGTGSEVTNVGVFTNRNTGKKVPMLSPWFWPDLALVDSTLTHTLPKSVTASTGMDAFCHAIEAYWNKESQPMCDRIAMQAMKLILENIKTAYDTPADSGARRNMSLGSTLAGVAFSQTRTTGIHAVSFPLTADFGLSHGEACAITLPAFIRVSGEKEAEKMRELARYLGYGDIEGLADGVEALMRSMGMRVRLHEAGIAESDIGYIAKVGLEAAIIHLSPAEMTEQTVTALLRSIF